MATIVQPDAEGRLVRPDGSVPTERYMAAVQSVELVGEPVDEVPIGYGNLRSLRLWRLDGPPRIKSILTGVREAGDMHEPAAMRVWDCAHGRLQLTLLFKLSTRVDLRVNGRLVRTLRPHGRDFVNTEVRGPPGASTCLFQVIPDSLLGSTRFEFVHD